VAEGSPTVRRRELGALLRKLREEKNLSVRDVTDHLLCSPSKVSRIETGQRGATLRDIRDLCDLYGVEDAPERDRLMTLAREAKEQGWWQSYDLPYSTYVGLEAEATSIKDFDSAVVPGLLQTADYAKARHEGAFPQLSPEIIDQRVEATLTRQRILTRGDQPKFWSVLDEAVLHRMVGGPQVTMDQIRQLIKVSAASNVTLQVIPFTVGTHPAVDSTFTILELPGIVKGVVYVEGLIGSVYLEKRDDLDRYEIIFDRLQQMALSPRKSVDLMRKIYSKHQHELSCENL
jgi:transcriptional regulator with XRE-family HTH domain